MNIQTERLEDQTARVTVEIDNERLDAAKHKAAQQISRRVNIPGFRKGKAPYRILLNYVGEAAILEDAVELLSQEVYKEVLPQTDLDPYGPGVLTDVKSEEATPTFVYVVPLQPSVDLKDYRATRLPYEPPEVTDEQVTRAVKNLQEQEAVVEESHQPAALGNRVTLDLHSYILGEHLETDEDEDADEEEDDHEQDDDHEEGEAHEHEHDHGDEDEGTPYIHEHDLQLILDEDDEPTPGFNDALVDANVGNSLVFTLDVPDDAEKYPEAAGKQVKYYVDVKKIETMTLPELTDDFAARISKDEEKPLTLLELRMRMRENLTNVSGDNYKNEYVRQALDQIIAQSDIKFPEAMVADQVDRFLQDLDQRLRQQGITLQDYMKIYQKSTDDLYNDYRDNAEQAVRRSLVLREIADVEGLEVTEDHVDEQIDKIAEQFDEERRDTIRKMFADQETMRDSVRSDLLRDEVLDRVVSIAKGEAPTISAPPAEEIPEAEAEAPEAATTDEVAEESTDETAESKEE